MRPIHLAIVFLAQGTAQPRGMWGYVWEFLGKNWSTFAALVFFLLAALLVARILKPAVEKGVKEGLEKSLKEVFGPVGEEMKDVVRSAKNQLAVISGDISTGMAASMKEVLKPSGDALKELVDLARPQVSDILQSWKGKPLIEVKQYIESEASQPAPPAPSKTKVPELVTIMRRAEGEIGEGRPDAAEGLLRQACEQFPQEFDGFDRLAQFMLERGRTRDALELLLPLRGRFLSEYRYFRRLGRAYQANADLNAALEAMYTGLSLKPEDAALHQYAAFISWLLGLIEDAVTEGQKALRCAQNTNMPADKISYIYNSLAFFYAERGDPKDKQEAFRLIEAALREVRNRPGWTHEGSSVLDTRKLWRRPTQPLRTSMKRSNGAWIRR